MINRDRRMRKKRHRFERQDRRNEEKTVSDQNRNGFTTKSASGVEEILAKNGLDPLTAVILFFQAVVDNKDCLLKQLQQKAE